MFIMSPRIRVPEEQTTHLRFSQFSTNSLMKLTVWSDLSRYLVHIRL